MKRHTVTEAEFDEWIFDPHWKVFACSRNISASSKSLEYTHHGLYRVIGDGDVVYQGDSMSMAIQTYNDLP